MIGSTNIIVYSKLLVKQSDTITQTAFCTSKEAIRASKAISSSSSRESSSKVVAIILVISKSVLVGMIAKTAQTWYRKYGAMIK